MISEVCSRWFERCARYRPAREVVDVSQYEVAAIPDDRTARAFVTRHHYSGSYPAARRRFGLYQRGGALVGVAVYSVPPRPEVFSVLGCAPEEAVELGRFVLLNDVAANAETFFLARCHKALRREGFEGVVTFADPHPRTSVDGTRLFGGHFGTIYQASSAVFLGRAHADTVLRLPDGRTFSRRSLSKIRARERGWRYAVDALVAAGAMAPNDNDLARWVETEGARVLRRERHPGCLKYAIPLSRTCASALPESLAYPRLAPLVCELVTARCA